MDLYSATPLDKPLDATVSVPGSKSITNRALVAAALADGHSLLQGALLADDTRLMIAALQKLGIAITVDEEDCNVEVTGCAGQLPASEATLECGNAGTVMRFLVAAVAASSGEFVLQGSARMHERPIGELVAALQHSGAGVEFLAREGYPPLKIYARGCTGAELHIDSPTSSQYISALLLAAPCARQDVLIEVGGSVTSRPYLQMTTRVMDAFGVAVIEQYDDACAKFICPAPQMYQAGAFAVEPDASNATYFLAAPAVGGGHVKVLGMRADSMQGDVRFADLLSQMGCFVEYVPDGVVVHAPQDGRVLRGIDVDLNDMPDVAQTLAVVALFADGPTTIRNVANLRVKETDRLSALATELRKLGAGIDEVEDGLTIHPPENIAPTSIETYDDHRMAMSFALATLRAADVTLNDPKCCSKTFPDFFQRWDAMRG